MRSLRAQPLKVQWHKRCTRYNLPNLNVNVSLISIASLLPFYCAIRDSFFFLRARRNLIWRYFCTIAFVFICATKSLDFDSIHWKLEIVCFVCNIDPIRGK